MRQETTARAVTGIEWTQAPTRVSPGQRFDLVVRVLGEDGVVTDGQPITFYINGDEFFTTSGADVPAGGFANDGGINLQIDEPGTYALTAEVAGFSTDAHFIGVGMEPDPSSLDPTKTPVGGGSPNFDLATGALAVVGFEALRRIFT